MFNRILLIALISVCLPLSAYADSDTKSVAAQLEELRAQVADLQTQLDAHTIDNATAHHYPGGPDIEEFENLLEGVSRFTDDFGYDTLQFSGMNVQIVNGFPLEPDPGIQQTNGTGNLIIGYNASRDLFPECPEWELADCVDRRDGSHMLVLGMYNNYTSYGGMVGGAFNETSGTYASVSGGVLSIASGGGSSVSGGTGNTASGIESSVSGGLFNTASGDHASVSGGQNKTAEWFACWEGDSTENC